MHVCMYACMHVCMYHVCMYVCIYVCARAYIGVCLRTLLWNDIECVTLWNMLWNILCYVMNI